MKTSNTSFSTLLPSVLAVSTLFFFLALSPAFAQEEVPAVDPAPEITSEEPAAEEPDDTPEISEKEAESVEEVESSESVEETTETPEKVFEFEESEEEYLNENSVESIETENIEKETPSEKNNSSGNSGEHRNDTPDPDEAQDDYSGYAVTQSAMSGSGVWEYDGVNTFYTSGFVGIGTATPHSLLEVYGGAITVVSLRASGSGNTPRGTADNDEVFRAVGTTSDYIIAIQDGSGRVQHYWNVKPSDETFLVSNEDAGKMDFNPNGNPWFELSHAEGGIAGNVIDTWDSHFAIAETGMVGIGTTTPQTQLDVRSGGEDQQITMSDYNGGEETTMGYSNDKNYFSINQNAGGETNTFFMRFTGQPTDTAFQFDTHTNSEALVITENGKIGVNTANPSQKFEVSGGNFKINFGNMFLHHNSNVNGTIGFNRGSNSHDHAQMVSYGSDSGLNESLGFLMGSGEVEPSLRMLLKTNGNVGIGTSNPNQKLHVAGDFGPSVKLQSTGFNSSTSYILGNDVRVWQFEVDGGDSDKLKIEDVSGGQVRMSFDNAGNVGIGTETPQSKLDVAGEIRAQQICDETGANCVDISEGWPSSGEGAGDGHSLDSADGSINDVVYVANDGNVGIGTIASTEKLQVDGNFKLNGNMVSDGDICIGSCN